MTDDTTAEILKYYLESGDENQTRLIPGLLILFQPLPPGAGRRGREWCLTIRNATENDGLPDAETLGLISLALARAGYEFTLFTRSQTPTGRPIPQYETRVRKLKRSTPK